MATLLDTMGDTLTRERPSQRPQGSLSKTEFRISVRKLGLVETPVIEIDALYDSLDADQSGDLDLAKVTVSMCVVAAQQ